MNDKPMKYIAEPSATIASAWIGVVVDRQSGRMLLQTLVAYRHPHQARFGARRQWAAWIRAQRGLVGDVA